MQLRNFDKPRGKAKTMRPKRDHKARHPVPAFLIGIPLDNPNTTPVCTLSAGRLMPVVEGHCGDVWGAVEGFLAGWRVSHPELYEVPPKPPKVEPVPAPALNLVPMVLDRALSAQWLKDFKTAHTAVSSSPALQLLVKRGSEYPLREPIALEAIAA